RWGGWGWWGGVGAGPAGVTRMSPARSPARAAGPSGTRSATRSPSLLPTRSCSQAGSGVGGPTMPREAPPAPADWLKPEVIFPVGGFVGPARAGPKPAHRRLD